MYFSKPFVELITILITLSTSNAVTATDEVVANAATSITLLYQNNLNASDDSSHVGALLLDPVSATQAASACTVLSENLLSPTDVFFHPDDFLHSLSYVAFSGKAALLQDYRIGNGQILRVTQGSSLSILSDPDQFSSLPVLCSQSSQSSQPSDSSASFGNQVTVAAGTNTYTGYRNQKSFRFLGVRYAEQPSRFEYSSVLSNIGQNIDATTYGSQCLQSGSGSEDCLFLNIQTPHIPRVDSLNSNNLRPVAIWIHGGAFTSGAGSDPSYDGGNLASREDVVVVTINYRLGSFGFLAIPNTTITGNYGIGDQETAIQWVRQNIAYFGGNPNAITIMGQSAGAQSVRAILSSPPAEGTFQAAIVLSNVGPMGLAASTTPDYLSAAQAYEIGGGQSIIENAGCDPSNLANAALCLKTANASLINSIATAAALVQDGYYINSPQLNVGNKYNSGRVAHVPVIFGNVENDGATFTSYPQSEVTSERQGLETILGISPELAQSIIASNLFPFANSGNLTADAFNVSQRINTDRTFRCVDQATVYAGVTTGVFPTAYYYQFDRTEGGLNFANLPGAPVTPGYPEGNPNLPYYKLHASEFPWVFGNEVALRDANDLYSIQLSVAYFGSFVRSYNPNPLMKYLETRGYSTVISALQAKGPWNPIRDDSGFVEGIDYPPLGTNFLDVPQCAFLNVSIDYYLQ